MRRRGVVGSRRLDSEIWIVSFTDVTVELWIYANCGQGIAATTVEADDEEEDDE